jgi:Kef-type K+ transport system membrane component KefB
MKFIANYIETLHITPILIAGIVTLAGFYVGKSTKFIKLPSIIGFMVTGLIFGPSVLNMLNGTVQEGLSFITEIALAFVAVSIGLELSFSSLRKQGSGIIAAIFTESFMAFFIVTGAIYLLTRDLPMALIFGAVAPASAPAGTVAIIQEYKARGPLTKALYAVVGFDDGLGIIIFGFASAISRSLLISESGGDAPGIVELLGTPLLEVCLSIIVGIIVGIAISFLVQKLKDNRSVFIVVFSLVLISVGLTRMFHLSLILTNMITGMYIVNTQPNSITHKITQELTQVMPLLFIMFFVLAGANLHIDALPALGLIGVIYTIGRSTGLVSGAFIGSLIGRLAPNIRNYLGLGILSQAGVAIGLSLIVKEEFSHISNHGMVLGATVLTTITATSIFFELIGPILTKIALEKAGEIKG